MRLVRLAIDRPVTALMLLVSVLLLGGIAAKRLPLAFLPEVDVPFIAVEIPYPNSSPGQVEDEVVEPVEEALATLGGVRRMQSTATPDGATFVLEFTWGQSLDMVRMQVSEKLGAVKPKLPEPARTVLISSFNTADIPVVEARLSAKGVDLSESYPLLEAHVLDRIRRVDGVARVSLNGVEPRHVFVDLVHEKLKLHRVDIGALVRRLQQASAQMTLGTTSEHGVRYTVRGLGSFESLAELGALPIGIGDLRLRDIAEISYEEPPIGYGRHLGREEAVGLSVYKESTANTVEVVDAVMRVVDDEIGNDPLLAGVEVFVWEDQAAHIRAGIDGLLRAGWIGALMAIVCLYLFLRRLDSTLIVAMSIPFSIIAACGVLYFLGKSLNLLSMMGLMLGIGMLVDNAIVVLESIDRCRETEPDARTAARKGASMVTTAVTTATVTTLIVFLPLVVGAENQLTTWLGEVGITISLALVCSLLSSLTLIPLVAAHRRRPPPTVRRFARVEGLYARVVGWTLRRRGWAALALVGVLGAGISPLAAGVVSTDMGAASVHRRLSLRYEFSDFHYKGQSEAVVDQVEAYLYDNADRFLVDEVYSYFAENQAGTIIILNRQDMDDDEVKALRAEIRDGLPVVPGARVKFDADSDEGGDSTYFSVNLYGRDGRTLERLTGEAEAALTQMSGVEDVSTAFEHGRNEVRVTIDRERALRRGISAENAAEAFGFTLGGMRLPAFRDAEREADVWLALRLRDRAGLHDLQGITFAGQEGPPVRLGDIASFETVSKPRVIEREDRQGHAWVRATYEGEDWDEARERIQKTMDGLDLPSGYSWSWDRRILERDTQNEEMGVNFLLALLLVYLVLASLFESVTQPVAILASVVFAIPGAACLLAATGTPLNLMAQIGLLILVGVVVNNAVVLLDRVNQLRADGVSGSDAFVQAGRDRLRPILMTAATTILGLAPLAVGGSAVGGGYYYPLARTVMGGLASSSILTLLALPLVTTGAEAATAWLHRVAGAARQRVANAAARRAAS